MLVLELHWSVLQGTSTTPPSLVVALTTPSTCHQSLVGNSRIITGAGNDVVNLAPDIANTFTGASIVGGAGNDSIDLGLWLPCTYTNTGSATNTYFFGSSGGLDTISFANEGYDWWLMANTLSPLRLMSPTEPQVVSPSPLLLR